jgi:hypothetical protein
MDSGLALFDVHPLGCPAQIGFPYLPAFAANAIENVLATAFMQAVRHMTENHRNHVIDGLLHEGFGNVHILSGHDRLKMVSGDGKDHGDLAHILPE